MTPRDPCTAREPAVLARLDAARHHPLETPAMVARLCRVDDRRHRAGMVGVNPAGLYRPGGRRTA